jgi:hypothetical protein
MNRRLNHGLMAKVEAIKHSNGQMDRTRWEIDRVQGMEDAVSGHKTMVGAATWIGISESSNELGDISSSSVKV